MSIDDIQLRLEQLFTELWAPDQEAHALRAAIAATYPRNGRMLRIDLNDAAGIAERRRLYAILDENSHRYGKLRAEQHRLQSELRRLTKQESAPPKKGRAAA